MEMSSFTATGRAGVSATLLSDYQCLGINPANLAFKPEKESKNITIGLAEMGFSVYSDALNRYNLASAIFDPDRKLSSSEKKQAAQDFAGKALTVNMDFLYGGISWQSDGGISGCSFTVRERAQWYSKFSPLASEIMFKGINAQYLNPLTDSLEYYFQNFSQKIDTVNGQIRIDTVGASRLLEKALQISKILDGSRIAMAWNREYSFGYGVNIVNHYKFKLNVGLGIRYIQGIGYLDLQSSGGKYSAIISASPGLGIKFPEKSKDTSSIGFLPNSAGRGIGFEFGLTAEISKKWRLAASITDIGSINYLSNVYTAKDGPLQSLSTRGFTNYNFFQNAQQFDGFQKEMILWESFQSRRIQLPTKARFGGSLSTLFFNAGFEVVVPLNNAAGNIIKPLISIGGDLKILKMIRISSGLMNGGNYTQTLVPFGITFSPLFGSYEIGIATRDILTYLRKNNPMISASAGFMRYRF